MEEDTASAWLSLSGSSVSNPGYYDGSKTRPHAEGTGRWST